MSELKDINELTQQDKDDLFQSYIELIDPPNNENIKYFNNYY